MRAQAFVHNWAKNGSIQGFTYMLSTGRFSFEDDRKISKAIGTECMRHAFERVIRSYYLNPNPKGNTKTIQKLAKDMAIAVGERHVLFKGADLN